MYPQRASVQVPLAPATQASTLATISVITGIATWFILPVIGALVAVITGHMAKREIPANTGRITGDGLATAGLVLGYLQLLVVVVPLVLLAACVALLILMDLFNPEIVYGPLRMFGF